MKSRSNHQAKRNPDNRKPKNEQQWPGDTRAQPRTIKVESIPLERITPGRNPRGKTDVSELATSMKEIGQLHPILVRSTENGFVILAGNCRFQAAGELGWKAIAACISCLDDIDSEIAGIDENLARHDLPFKVATRQLARRKELHEAKFPETRRGAVGRKGKSRSNCDSKRPRERFTKEAARITGKSERQVQKLVKLGNKATDELLDAVDLGVVTTDEAEKLAALPPAKQRQAVKKATTRKKKPSRVGVTSKAVERLGRCAVATFGAAQRLMTQLQAEGAALRASEIEPTRERLLEARKTIDDALGLLEPAANGPVRPTIRRKAPTSGESVRKMGAMRPRNGTKTKKLVCEPTGSAPKPSRVRLPNLCPRHSGTILERMRLVDAWAKRNVGEYGDNMVLVKTVDTLDILTGNLPLKDLSLARPKPTASSIKSSTELAKDANLRANHLRKWVRGGNNPWEKAILKVLDFLRGKLRTLQLLDDLLLFEAKKNQTATVNSKPDTSIRSMLNEKAGQDITKRSGRPSDENHDGAPTSDAPVAEQSAVDNGSKTPHASLAVAAVSSGDGVDILAEDPARDTTPELAAASADAIGSDAADLSLEHSTASTEPSVPSPNARPKLRPHYTKPNTQPTLRRLRISAAIPMMGAAITPAATETPTATPSVDVPMSFPIANDEENVTVATQAGGTSPGAPYTGRQELTPERRQYFELLRARCQPESEDELRALWADKKADWRKGTYRLSSSPSLMQRIGHLQTWLRQRVPAHGNNVVVHVVANTLEVLDGSRCPDMVMEDRGEMHIDDISTITKPALDLPHRSRFLVHVGNSKRASEAQTVIRRVIDFLGASLNISAIDESLHSVILRAKREAERKAEREARDRMANVLHAQEGGSVDEKP